MLILAVALGAATGAYADPSSALVLAVPAIVALVLLVLAVRARRPRRRRDGEASDVTAELAQPTSSSVRSRPTWPVARTL